MFSAAQGGRNTIVMHNTCEDSLLAAPLILDLVILAEVRPRWPLSAPLSSPLLTPTSASLLLPTPHLAPTSPPTASALQLITRIELRRDGEPALHGFHPVAVLLSYLTKAPLVPPGTMVINALAKQRAMLENVLRACVGLPPENNMMLETK